MKFKKNINLNPKPSQKELEVNIGLSANLIDKNMAFLKKFGISKQKKRGQWVINTNYYTGMDKLIHLEFAP